MKNNRVVITGLGVCAPNGVGIPDFLDSIKKGRSGIRHFSELERLNFSCQIGGMPPITEADKLKYFTPLQLRNFKSFGIAYGVLAGIEAWEDARLTKNPENCDFDAGTIFGAGNSSVDKFRESLLMLDAGKVRRLGSNSVQQIMASGVSAYLGGMLGLGNIVTTNSSACATGTEAILFAYERIKSGKAKRILAGSASDGGPYVWGGFDALRILPSQYNNIPEEASRPMDADACGFVPGCGAGAMVLEDLDSALARNATIYAEILGGESNSGGQRNGGSMTAPNPIAVKRCITKAIENAGISAIEIDTINGHLTATTKDADEISNWAEALGRYGADFPPINSLKGMTGHCLAAAGSIECVASVLQLKEQFLFPNINIKSVNPEIQKLVSLDKIPLASKNVAIKIIAKASFGFGDVNCCVIFKRF